MGSGSFVSPRGKALVEANSIDNILEGSKATFIKMDVEGAELKSLQGAEKTIRQYKSKLAICIYHKPEDIVQIPCYLESLGMNYKYYIRHYQTILHETVLYAV